MNSQIITSISSGNLSAMNYDFSKKKILIIAKRGSGKSFFTNEIIKLINQTSPIDMQNTIVVSPTERMNKFYSDKFNCEILYDVINLSTVMDKKFIILDDCLHRNIRNTQEYENLADLIKTDITLIVCLQYPYFDRYLMGLFDYILLGQEDFLSSKKKIYERIYIDSSFDEFNTMMKNLQPYHWLLVDNRISKEMYANKEIKKQEKLMSKITKNINTKNMSQITLNYNPAIVVYNTDEKENINIVRNIIKNIEQFHEIIAVNNVGENNYSDIINKVHKPDSKNILENLLAVASGEANNKLPRLQRLLILEYSVSELMKKHNNALTELIYNGRHYFIGYIIVEKYVLSLAPELRGNLDYIIAGDVSDKATLQKLYDGYFGMLPSFSMFKEAIRLNTLFTNNRGVNAEDKLLFLETSVVEIAKKYSGEIYTFEEKYNIKPPKNKNKNKKNSDSSGSDPDSESDSDSEYDIKSVIKYMKKLDKKMTKINNKLKSL
ncbi:MAG: P-loop NTPase domain protein [Terrestrivirus sp.]|uniref:P-loop NTPase domain protein n=1 Tax=Terrestrivirus sp. TaxID=2487775 RepID=A0A3G4ZP99_9VIRU|nr:MAG: P-loop NTPase domain protein [Terrestrivirus sp.]